MKDWLYQGLAYNLWANRLWLAYLTRLPNPEPAMAVLQQLLSAQRTWGKRCDCGPLPAESEEIYALLDAYYEAWMAVAKKRQLAEHVVYRDEEGEALVRPFAEIALHIINQGAHQRGQIRAISIGQGMTDCPETDLITYLDQLRR